MDQGDSFFNAPSAPARSSSRRWIEPAEDAGVPMVDGVYQGIRLEANLQYFEGRPHLDALVFRAIWNDPDYEGVSRPLNQMADCLETDVESYADWVAVKAERFLALRYLYFPNNVRPYDNPKVRLAINYALDKRSFLDAAKVTAGTEAASGVVPPGIPGFIPKESHYDRDLVKARELMAEAGYPGGRGLPAARAPRLAEEYLSFRSRLGRSRQLSRRLLEGSRSRAKVPRDGERH